MPVEQVWMASLHMDGVAAEWYYALICEEGLVQWPRFTELVNLRFGPPIRSNPLGELKVLQRTDTVEEYQRQFLALLCRCDDLSPQHQMNMFTAGLGEPLTSDVELQKPADLQTAMSLARAFEKRGITASTTAPTRSSGRARSGAPAATTTQAASSAPFAASAAAPSHRSRLRRLTPEEMAEKRKKNECYFCPEQYSVGHKCSTKGVYLLEMEDDEELAAVQEELGISLSTLTGVTTSRTMKLRVTMGGRELMALVDSGSTHTFIHDTVARRLGLDITHRPGLTVKVANGEQVISLGVCRATTVLIEGEPFTLDCYALPLEGFDVILGVQWLKLLGPIIWDFDALTVAFWRDGHAVRWTGVGSIAPSLLTIQSAVSLLDALPAPLPAP